MSQQAVKSLQIGNCLSQTKLISVRITPHWKLSELVKFVSESTNIAIVGMSCKRGYDLFLFPNRSGFEAVT